MAHQGSNIGKTQKKILIILFGGLALGLSGSPRQYYKILTAIQGALKEVDNQAINRSLSCLEKRGYVQKKKVNNTFSYHLTKKGMSHASRLSLDELILPTNNVWDGKWRLVLSDIPETHKRMRDSLRYHAKQKGFFELQKSVWAYPYECKKELDFLVTCHKAQEFVHYVVADYISKDTKLKKHFKL